MIIKIDDDEYVDVWSVARMFDCSKSTIDLKIRAKELPEHIKLPARIFWKKSEIEEYLLKSERKNEK